MGRSSGSPLLPLFRSKALVAILEQLYVVGAGEDRSISDIARSADLPYTTTQREINRLMNAGLVTTRAVGRSRLVTVARDHAATQPIRTLMMLTVGPRHRIARAIDGLDGVHRAFIHGSWADRYLGNWGEPPADIDVLVIGGVDQQELYDRLQPVEMALGIQVNPIVVSLQDWEAADSGFLKSVAAGPLIPVDEDEPS
ncbi:MAG: helix-turn-helix domain-containing protein [Actinomycetota bacterium]